MRTPQDLEANEQLDNASEERIFQILDNIVETGKYTEPDMFMDLDLANELVVNTSTFTSQLSLKNLKPICFETFSLSTNIKAGGDPASTSGHHASTNG